MRTAEWIQILACSYFAVLAWLRPLPLRRRVTVASIAALAIALTAVAAFALPRLLPPLPVSVVRDWLPAALMLAVYRQAGAFFVRVDRRFQDGLERLDERYAAAFFRWVARRGARAWIAAYLETAYLLCYPMIPLSLGALYVCRLGSHVDRFWTVVLTSTYAAYAVLPFLQALPPRMLEEPWLTPLPSNPVRRFNLWILRHASIHANTFPSAHVAASTAAALVLITIAPWGVGLVFTAIATGIAFGTFAGRYHYAADSLAGAALAATVFLIAEW